ncbi:MAG: acyl-CoA dehydrogenase family protein [Anaerolineales bacterium]
MFGFEPTEEQKMLVDAVRRYAENDLRVAAHEADESGELPPALIEKGWELGVLQASVPEQYGGFGERSAVTGALAAEELAWGDLSGALAVMAPGAFALSVLLSGSKDQKSEFIPPVIEAEWRPYITAYTEPDFDFYAAEMRTIATADNGDYLISGRKAQVPFAESALNLLTFASFDGKVEGFAVPAEAEGLQVGEREQLLGIQALPTYTVMYDEVRIPASARMEGTDPSHLVASFNVAVGALAIGLSRAAYEYALDYAKEREAFGVPIAQKQAIAFMLAEMATEIDGARLMVWEAAWEIDQGKDASKSAYVALSNASDTAMMATDRAVQILGGHGYIREHPVERWMRNARGLSTFAGMAMV